MFEQGYAIYAFNLAPSDLGEEYVNLVQQGSVRLAVRFSTNTTQTLNCIAYAEFPALIEVDLSRCQIHDSINTNQLLCTIQENGCLSSLTETVYSADTLPITVTAYPSVLYVIQIPSIFRENIGLCFGFKILIIQNARTV